MATFYNPYRYSGGGGGVSTEPIHWWNMDTNSYTDNGTSPWTLSVLNNPTQHVAGPGGQTVTHFGGPTSESGELYKSNTVWDGSGNQISVSVWASILTAGSGGGVLVDWRAGNFSPVESIIEMQVGNSNQYLISRTRDSAANGNDVIYAITENAVNYVSVASALGTIWNHIVMTFDGTTLLQYVNGNLLTNRDTPSEVNVLYDGITNQPAPFGIGGLGRSISSTNYWLRSYMGMIGIWDVALTTDDISALYNNGNGLQYDGSVWS